MTPTVVSRLTAAGRSAVAVIGLCGPRAEECIAACFQSATSSRWRVGQVRYGTWRPPHRPTGDSIVGESVVLTPIGETHFEIHGHGGAAAVSRIIDSLVQLGATSVDAATWDQQLSGLQHASIEPLLAEAAQVLIASTTRPNAAIALQQYRGALLAWTLGWIERLTQQPEALQQPDALQQPEALGELKHAAAELWQRRSIGQHLTAPYRVVLAGPPNVGKSSLVNRIVGYGRSITHDEAGTTRDVVDCDTVIAGLPIRLRDTAGIRAGGGVIEREGIRRGAVAIASADLILIVVDPTTIAERAAIETTIAGLTDTADVLRVLNKSDQIADIDFVGGDDPGWIQTIATSLDSEVGTTIERGGRNGGIDGLISAIAQRLRPDPLPEGAPLPINERQSQWIAAIAKSSDATSALRHLHSLRSGADNT